MSKVPSTIEAKVREMFPDPEAQIALTALSEMTQPPMDGEWANTRVRVQTAILISAQSNIDKLLKGVERSQIDWRDTLVSAGLSDANWSKVAKEYGFDYT